jgi:hypothetical protein
MGKSRLKPAMENLATRDVDVSVSTALMHEPFKQDVLWN